MSKLIAIALQKLTCLYVVNRQLLLLSIASLLISPALALPDDQSQLIDISAKSMVYSLDGLIVYTGSEAEPAIATQGSLSITGLKITAERENGVVYKVTVLGQPAHFQQQPEIDQKIISGNGNKIVFNKPEQLLSIEDNANFFQNSDTISAHHIDYELNTKTIQARSAGNGERVRTILSPKSD